jgi:hypothetical protein
MEMQPKKLPQGILVADLQYPRRGQHADKVRWEDRSFELWYVPSFGWCIPTLQIRGVSRRSTQTTPRTYAVTVNEGKVVRIGLGPHVTLRHTVHVRKNRVAALKRYIELRNGGAVKANTIRDQISSRRAQTILRRGDIYGF